MEGVVPAAEILLNGITIGTTHDPWDVHRFEVTDRLRPRNELTLRFEKDFEKVGIRRQIALSIESRLCRLAGSAWEWNEATHAEALRGKLHLVSSHPELPIEILLEVNGHCVWRQSLTLTNENTNIEIVAGPFDLDSWRPRRWGLPVLHDIHLVIRRDDVDGVIVHEETWKAGFRQLDLMLDYDKPAMIDIHRSEELRVRRLSQADVMNWQSKDPSRMLGHDWDVDMIVLESVLAPDRLYDLADRMGVMVRHEVAGDPSLERAIRRHSRHPSVLIDG